MAAIATDEPTLWVGSEVKKGLDLLLNADEVIGHNLLGYDVPLLELLYGCKFTNKIYDTLVVSHLIFTELFDQDARQRKIPKALWGKHSLKAWGYRLDCYKGDYDGGWDTYTPEMGKYCKQDTVVSKKLYEYLMSLNYSVRAIDIEHEFKKIIHQQEQNGILFDTAKAKELQTEVAADVQEFKKKLLPLMSDVVKRTPFVPKRDNRTLGYKKGVEVIKVKRTPPNPGSRVQVIKHFEAKGWRPKVFTKKGNPSIGAEILRDMDFEEAELFADYFDRIKVLGYLSEGKESWLKHVKNGRIHGAVNTNGAVTGRCTHAKPNLAQVPSVRGYKGKECRELFHAGNGWMIGADASGLELRMLGHYMAKYDGGSYAKEVITGDIHTTHQQAGELPTRDHAKTFIYAFLYGAGDEKLGSIITGTKNADKNKKAGRELRRRFVTRVDGLADLIRDVKRGANRGYLRGLDGRKLLVRSDHKALNTLLQGAGAVIMKQANINFWKINLLDCYQVLNIHDEWEVVTLQEQFCEQIGKNMVDAIVQAGEDFDLRIALDGEYKIGKNWREVH